MFDPCVTGTLMVNVRKLHETGDKATKDGRSYGTLEDIALADQQFTIHGSTARISHLYVSQGHEVKIWVTAGLAPRDHHRFVIHYRSKF